MNPPERAKPPGSARNASEPVRSEAGDRLQKVLAAAGIASRRASEELILQGRIKVNGQTVTELGTKVNPTVDEILIDGEPLPKLERFLYILLNKPIGVHSTTSDERGRKTVLDLVPMPDRVYPVGRLDADSEGLILLTNDGALTERMTHPRYGHAREYRVLVFGQPDQKALGRLRRGVVLEDGPSGPAEVDVLSQAQLRDERLPFPQGNASWLKMVIREGRKRQVRRMCELIGHPVMRLIRVGMGPLVLGDLPTGAYRTLTDREVARLRESVGMGGRKRRAGERPPVRRPRPQTAAEGAERGSSKRHPPAGRREPGVEGVARRGHAQVSGARRESPADLEKPRRPRAARPQRDDDRPPKPEGERPPRREGGPAGRDSNHAPTTRTPRVGRTPAADRNRGAVSDRPRGARTRPGTGRKRGGEE